MIVRIGNVDEMVRVKPNLEEVGQAPVGAAQQAGRFTGVVQGTAVLQGSCSLEFNLKALALVMRPHLARSLQGCKTSMCRALPRASWWPKSTTHG